MQTVIVVIHVLVVIALVAVILVQRSEGGGLGVGGGSGFMSARGTKTALTRLTAILAVCFFLTSIALIVASVVSKRDVDILNRIPEAGQTQKQPQQQELPPFDVQLDGPEGAKTLEKQSGASAQKSETPQQSESPIPGG